MPFLGLISRVYLPGFVPLGNVTKILLSLLIFIVAFEITVPLTETIFDLDSFNLTDFEIFILTAVDLPGTILVEGVAITGLVVDSAFGDEVGLGDAVGVAETTGLGVGICVTPPPLFAGVVDAGVTPSIVTDVDSIERADEPIAFVART